MRIGGNVARGSTRAPGGPAPACRPTVARVGFRQAAPANFRPSGRSPPGSRKNSNFRYGPPPFSGTRRVANERVGPAGSRESMAADRRLKRRLSKFATVRLVNPLVRPLLEHARLPGWALL